MDLVGGILHRMGHKNDDEYIKILDSRPLKRNKDVKITDL